MATETQTKSTRLVSARWTSALAKGGWTPVVNFFLDNYHRLNPPIKYSEAMFIIHLMRHKWEDEAPYPGFKSLAKRMGISVQSARLQARSLAKKKYLFREFQKGETNKFHLKKLFDALEILAEVDAIEKALKRKAAKRLPPEEASAEAIAAARAKQQPKPSKRKPLKPRSKRKRASR